MMAADQAPRRWALITGGSRGIGRAVALELAERDWNLGIVYLRNDAAAEEVGAAVRARGGVARLYRSNLARREDCVEVVGRCAAEIGCLHGFVHCAGLGALSPVLATRDGRWRMAWDTHFGAFVELLSQGRDLLGPGSSVVALTSLGAHRVMPGYGSIAAAKGALEAIVRYLAAELAERGVNVNAVCGGPVETESLRSFASFDALDAESRRRPCGRLAQPADLAPVVAFLLSPAARWIRGQVVVADGGFGLY
jgi:enoyl-[acyl-carrier protein] reductase III